MGPRMVVDLRDAAGVHHIVREVRHMVAVREVRHMVAIGRIVREMRHMIALGRIAMEVDLGEQILVMCILQERRLRVDCPSHPWYHMKSR